MVRLGVLGGTFDPVHLGHLIIAQESAQRAKLDSVLFVPAARPWMKGGRSIAPVEHRVAMVRLAIRGNPRFALSLVDVARGGPSYAVDTLTDLRRQYGGKARLFFIMGYDSLAGLPQWRDPGRLVALGRFIAVSRPGQPRPNVQDLDRRVPGLVRRLTLIEGVDIGISATEVRRRARAGLSIRYWVPPVVERYIQEHRLYTRPRNGS